MTYRHLGVERALLGHAREYARELQVWAVGYPKIRVEQEIDYPVVNLSKFKKFLDEFVLTANGRVDVPPDRGNAFYKEPVELFSRLPNILKGSDSPRPLILIHTWPFSELVRIGRLVPVPEQLGKEIQCHEESR